MKYTNIFKSLFLLAGLVVATNVWGGTANSTFKDINLATNEGTLSWSAITAPTGFEGNNYKRGLQWGSGKSSTLSASVPESPTITKVVVVASANGSTSKLAVKVGSTTFYCDNNATADIANGTASANASYEFTGSATGSVSVIMTNNTSNKSTWIQSITITYDDPIGPCTTEVAITKGVESHGTYSLSSSKACADGAGGTISVIGITPADGYQFKEIQTSNSGTVDNVNKKVTEITAATTITVVFSKASSASSEIEVVAVTKDNGIVVEYDLPGSATITLSQQEEHQEGKLAEELFFSKYFEAARSVKLLAVFNGTKKSINLSDYTFVDMHASDNATSFNVTERKFSEFLPADRLVLKSGEELIMIAHPDNDATDNEIIKCAKEKPTSGWDKYVRVSSNILNFNGNDALALKNPADQTIDIIGAFNYNSTYIKMHTTKFDFMDDPGWYSAKGRDTISTHTNNYALSTNRCLLIRKKDVTSGADAVRLNQQNFVTLGDYKDPDTNEDKSGEWRGCQIPGNAGTKTSPGITNACAGFEAVGSFDYGSYYNQWQELPSSVITSTPNPDGTVTITIADLPDRACKTLKIEVKDGTNTVENYFDVPIIVKSDHSTKDEIFNKMKDTCKICDVVILDGATLTKVDDNNKHFGDSARVVDVYAGGKLVVPSGRKYHAEEVILRTQSTTPSLWTLKAPEVVFNQNSQIAVPNSTTSPALGQRVRLETGSGTGTDLNFYMVSFPFNVTLADVTFSDGTPAELNTDYFIYYYNGETRAASQNAYGNWVAIPASTTELEAGKGYLVAAAERPGHQYRELYFPMNNPALNVGDGEPTNKITSVNAWGWQDDNIRPNHKGWNFISNPYLRDYQKNKLSGDNAFLSLDFLVQGEDGYWSLSGTAPTIPYVTILNSNGTDYTQVKVADAQLKAFTPFFVQIGTGAMTSGEGAQVQFKAANRVAAAPGRRMTTDRPTVSSLGLLIEGAEAIDNCGIVIGEQYGPAYELMADLSKEFGSAYSLKAYTLQDGDNMRLAFHAMHPDRLANTIPVGVRMPATAEYTFRIDKRYDLSDFEHVWLHDAETGEYTDLLYNDYTFNGTKQQNDSRFKLTVSLRPKTPTDVDHVLSGIFVNGRDGALMISGLPEEASVYVYDLNGRLLVSDHTQRLNTAIYPLSTGVYQVRVEGNGQNALLKAIVK